MFKKRALPQRYLVCLILTMTITGCSSRNMATTVAVNDKRIYVTQTQTKGNCVAIAFSRAANTVYTGRSYKSIEDALDIAVKSCTYSDCRSFYAWKEDGCVSFAQNEEQLRRWGKGVGESAKDSEIVALKYCNADNVQDTCYTVVTLCPAH